MRKSLLRSNNLDN